MQERKWDIDIAILTNTIVMREVIYVFGIAFGAVAGLLFGLFIHENGIGGLFAMEMDSDLQYPLMLMGIWFVLTALFILVFWRNKYPLTYTVDSKGVYLESRKSQVKKNQRVGCLLMLLGAFMGQVGAVGMGLLATGNQDMIMNWKDVKKVKLYPRKRVILLKGGYGVRMILFCKRENYEDVVKVVHSQFHPV